MTDNPNTTQYTIPSSSTTGSAVTVNRDAGFSGVAVVGIVLPAAMTGTKVTLQIDHGDGTLRDVTGITGTAAEVTFAANNYVWLDPAITAGAKGFALKSDASEAAERTFGIVMRQVH